MSSFLRLFLLLLVPLSVASQKQWSRLKFQRFGVDQGLTVTTAFNIVQDEHGFLWISTIDGLLRYDGYKFFAYKNNYNDSASISDNTVSMLLCGKGNKLWAGTYSGGLNCLDIATGKFKRFQNNPTQENSLSNNRVWAICETGNVIWAGTENGLNRIDLQSGKITRYFHEQNQGNNLCSNVILSLLADTEGNLWVGTVNGLSKAKLDENNNIISFINYKNDPNDVSSLSSNIVMSLFKGKDRSVYAGTSDGLCRLDPTKNNFKVFRFASKSDPAANQVYSYLNSYGPNAVRAVYEDKSGLLWIATDKGLQILNPKTGERMGHYADPNNPQSLSADLLYGICEDSNGNLWIGTIIGGLNRANLKQEKFELIQTQNGNPHDLAKNNIRAIYKDRSGTLWIGNLEGGINRLDAGKEKFDHLKGKVPASENIWAIYEDSKGWMWFGSSSGLYRYDKKSDECKRCSNCPGANSISNNIVRSIFEDSTGIIWVGTEGGLNSYDPVKDLWRSFEKDEKNKNSLSHNTVWCIRQHGGVLWVGTDNGLNKINFNAKTKNYDFKHFLPEKENKNSISNRAVRSIWTTDDSVFWIGTSNGLNKFNPSTEKFTRFNEENGLTNAYIYGVLGDENSNLWISTNNGISRFNKITEQFHHYDKLDGLQNNEFNTGAYFKATDGEMFFGGPDGFNSFYPGNLSENKNPPPIVITSIKLFGMELQSEMQPFDLHEIKLHHDQNVISFEFSALDFTLPEKNYYAYMLEGFDKGWVKSGSRRFVNYTNLDPGKYKFKVRACNSDGTWNNEGISVQLTIVPPYWKTWWFKILIFVSIALTIYGIYLQRINRFRKVQVLLEAQVSLKTKELREEKEIVLQQNKIIGKKNHDITSSIQYAKRIQDSILPSTDRLKENVKDAFVFYKPKDIVSGDFYWFHKKDHLLFITVADCTGHGVPGAFMSLIGYNLLNDAVKAGQLNDPAEILSALHRGLVNSLKQENSNDDSVDGMDIALCVLNLENKMMEYSATDRPLNLIRNGALQNFRLGEYPLGYISKHVPEFRKEKIQLQEGDIFYLFTDGYCDQFGGIKNEKYLEGNFESFLLQIHTLSMNEQHDKLRSEMQSWQGSHSQIDDMLVIGVRI